MTVMSDESPATRREVDQLTSRIDSIDRHGTRNSGLQELAIRQTAAAVESLKSEMTAGFANHARQHELDRQERISGRRWRIGAFWGALGAVAALVAALFTIAGQLAHIGA